MNAENARPRIADIIRESGKMGPDASPTSQSELASIAAAISGGSAGAFLASEAVTDELAKRFPKLATTAAVERDGDAGYATAARALVLALQSCGFNIVAAFDTEGGSVLEVKKPLSLLAPAFSVIVAVSDRGATTHFRSQAQHTGMDWGQNAKLLNQLFDKTNEYLQLFKS